LPSATAPRPTFQIGERHIGGEAPPYLVAEAGVNHNGDLELALALVDAAADAGADAVKFQTFHADELASDDAPVAGYQRRAGGGESQREMLRSLELPGEAFAALAERARERDIEFLSTPFDLASVELLAGLGVRAMKVGSGDLTNLVLLHAIAGHRVPVILSTGMATLEEIDAAIAALTGWGVDALAILQCTSAYPAPIEDVNLRAIPLLRDRYGVPVGFSDHTLGINAAIAAAGLGAAIVEKHMTLDRSMPGPDHAASLEPGEMRQLANALAEVARALGDGRKEPRASEEDVRRVARRSLVARRRLEAGSVVKEGDLDARRPADGISPLRLTEVIGRRLRTPLEAGARLAPGDLDPPLSGE